MKAKKHSDHSKAKRKRRLINKDLRTWARQIRKAIKKGQSQDIPDWPEFF